MRAVTILSCFLFFLLSSPSGAFAYSSTSDCDRWDVARLASVGIRVGAYAHPLQTEIPAREWIYIEFDCTRYHSDRQILLTAKLRAKAGTSADVRAERSKDNPKKLVLRLTLSDDLIAPFDRRGRHLGADGRWGTPTTWISVVVQKDPGACSAAASYRPTREKRQTIGDAKVTGVAL